MLEVILCAVAAVALIIILLVIVFAITCYRLAGYITKEFEHINGERS